MCRGAAWLLVNDAEAQPADPIWLACDINPERSWGTISAAGSDVDGTRAVIEVIESREGTSWIAPMIERIRSNHDVAGVIIDGTGPASVLEADLLEPPTKLPYAEVVTACQSLYDAIVNDTVTIRTHSALTAAMRGAVKLGSGDGSLAVGPSQVPERHQSADGGDALLVEGPERTRHAVSQGLVAARCAAMRHAPEQ